MKNLKYIVFSYLLIFGLAVQAQDAPEPETALSQRTQDLMQTGTATATANGQAAAAQQFRSTIQRVFQSSGPNQELNTISNLASSATSSSGLQAFITELGSQVSQCGTYVQDASRCCSDAATCGGANGSNFREMASAAASIAPMMAALFGGENGGGMASCLSALPGIIDGMGVSEGESAVCRLYRDGQQGASGCRDYCGTLSRAADTVKGNIPAIAQSEGAPVSTFSNAEAQLDRFKNQLNEHSQTCVSNTSQGEAEAEEASNQMQQTAQSAVSCADAFANEDEDLTEDDLNTPTPINPADISGLSSGNGNPLSKAGYETFGSGTVGGEEFDDAPNAATPGSGSGNGNQNAGLGGGMGGFPGGMGGMGAGQGGAAQKTGDNDGRGTASKKASNLISGYGKPSGSSASGSRSGKKGKFRFAALKKKNEDDKKGAKAFAKLLAAAGVSPNSQDDIFERNTKRFVAASVKEKLFDAKKNKKLWMK